MKISKRVREEAAQLCSMSANASAAFDGDISALAFLGEAQTWSHASSEAIELARNAMDACCDRYRIKPWHLRDAAEKAEAEALLRTGWSPS